MKSVFFLVLAFCCVTTFAKATTRPTASNSAAATKPSVAQSHATTRSVAVASTTRPSAATQPTARHFPTPAELIEKMKAQKAKRQAMPKIAYFDLSKHLREKPEDFTFLGDHDTLTLKDLLDRLHRAQEDKSVRAVLITLGSDSPSFAQAQEVRDALLELNKAGKQTFVYADSYDTDSYTLATGAEHICMLEGGDVMLPGVGLQTMFAKGLLDKIGVQADAIQIGEYKGADEEFTRTGPSDELRGELNKLTQSLYDEIVDGISLNRNLTREDVRRDIDDCIIRGPVAKQRGLVDHLVDEEGLRKLIKDETNEKQMMVLSDYGAKQREAPDFSNPFAIFAAMARRPAVSDKPSVAMIYAVGTIVDGHGGDGMFGSVVGAEDIREAMRTARRDPEIKAVVLRINSPGGSALASEVMWQAARHLAARKPLIVSIGGMAASGGYYLASAADTIYADPSAIVGSIGVVGGKFVYKGLMQKLGISTASFSRGANADLFSSDTPFTARQRRMLTHWMRQTYDQFTERVMTTRKNKIKDIDKVARGRVFVARQAIQLGMVDELGGTTDAIACAARQAHLKAGDYAVRILPPAKTLADYFGFDSSSSRNPFAPKVTISPDSLLGVLGPRVSAALGQQIQMLQLLQTHPVLLMMPMSVQVN